MSDENVFDIYDWPKAYNLYDWQEVDKWSSMDNGTILVDLATFKSFILKNKIKEINVHEISDWMPFNFTLSKHTKFSISTKDIMIRMLNYTKIYIDYDNQISFYNNAQKLILVDEIFKDLIKFVKAKLIIDRL